MARRSLVDGLKKVDRRKEWDFVKGKPDTAETEESKTPRAKPERNRERAKAAKPKPESKEQRGGEESTPAPAPVAPPAYTGRVPLTTRLRADIAEALTRASLERKLAKVTPNTVQELLEEALEPWLKGNGYLKE